MRRAASERGGRPATRRSRTVTKKRTAGEGRRRAPMTASSGDAYGGAGVETTHSREWRGTASARTMASTRNAEDRQRAAPVSWMRTGRRRLRLRGSRGGAETKCADRQKKPGRRDRQRDAAAA
ncbi:hypothetical protein Scep_013195 [Stephania cephalantha]|uniref:Uncharacterized protein n=1 Tax=Stephania cephalantha TaxID=152367 RepID=A0AAP0JIV0_9MAGN